MPFWKWSQVANNNGTADSSCPWNEGMAPSQINDSARANMARLAEYRDDIAGAIATGGSSTAYTVTSYQVFDTLAHMSGQMIAFTPHTTSGATVTLNVDGLGAKPLRSATSVELPAGTLIQGTPYLALYNNSDAAFYLHGFFGNPYNIPIGGSIDYWLPTAPNSSFVFPYGQAISRTTYATLFASMSTTYGTGDGSTTFNLPDLRGRMVASPDNMGGGADPARLSGGSLASVRNSIGGAGGTSAVTLVAAQIPSITSSGAISVTSTASNIAAGTISTSLISGGTGASFQAFSSGTVSASSASSTGTANVTSNNTGSTAVDKMPPTILCNRIMRII